MKRLLGLLGVLVLVPSLAIAGWNIRQEADGTATWINGAGETVPVGRDLTVLLEDVSTASTTFVVSPVSGTVTWIRSAMHGEISTHDVSLTMSIASSGSTTFTDAAGSIAISFSETSSGTMDEAVITSGGTVAEGGVIAIRTSGYSTTDTDATITIRIEAQ